HLKYISTFKITFYQQELNLLAGAVRGELPKLARATLCALITINVHARDIISEMVKKQ
ncbi:dynein heavy chain 6 axonemal, partial [Biomphalaria glabrata]